MLLLVGLILWVGIIPEGTEGQQSLLKSSDGCLGKGCLQTSCSNGSAFLWFLKWRRILVLPLSGHLLPVLNLIHFSSNECRTTFCGIWHFWNLRENLFKPSGLWMGPHLGRFTWNLFYGRLYSSAYNLQEKCIWPLMFNWNLRHLERIE